MVTISSRVACESSERSEDSTWPERESSERSEHRPCLVREQAVAKAMAALLWCPVAGPRSLPAVDMLRVLRVLYNSGWNAAVGTALRAVDQCVNEREREGVWGVSP